MVTHGLRCTLPPAGYVPAPEGKRLPLSNSTAPSPLPPSRSDQWHAVAASFLGWTLDAFDFFVVVFLVDTLALHFHVAKSAIVWTMTATLAMRPVGAIVFGLLADRYGRRKPLMANVVFFSVVELLCGFAPSYTVFLILRTIYGIGMGGEWGVGASLAMESAPAEVARHFVRHRAKRIFHWLPAGGRGGAICSACLGLARHVLGRRRARAAGAVHPLPGARVGGMATTPGPDRESDRAHRQRVIGRFFFILSC